MKRWRLVVWLALQAATLASPELIFKVPEVRHAAVARPTSRPTAEPSTNSSEEPAHYYMEHEVSIDDARKAAQLLNLHQAAGPAAVGLAGCGACSRWEREYCAGGVLGDHCCCERRYMREPFPWLPHACFLPAARCRLAADNCARYSRIRDCCCNDILAHKWKAILSKASQLSLSGMVLLVFGLVLFSLYL